MPCSIVQSVCFLKRKAELKMHYLHNIGVKPEERNINGERLFGYSFSWERRDLHCTFHIQNESWKGNYSFQRQKTQYLEMENYRNQKTLAFSFSTPSSFTSAVFQSQRHEGIRSYSADVNVPFSPKAYTQTEKKNQNKKTKQNSLPLWRALKQAW